MVFIVYSDQLAELPAPQLQAAITEKLEKAGILEAKSTPRASSHAIVKPKES